MVGRQRGPFLIPFLVFHGDRRLSEGKIGLPWEMALFWSPLPRFTDSSLSLSSSYVATPLGRQGIVMQNNSCPQTHTFWAVEDLPAFLLPHRGRGQFGRPWRVPHLRMEPSGRNSPLNWLKHLTSFLISEINQIFNLCLYLDLRFRFKSFRKKRWRPSSLSL